MYILFGVVESSRIVGPQFKECSMVVEEIQIVPSNGRDISFKGELIARATSDRSSTPLGDRWFDLRVYKESGHGFVPVIDFFSTCEGEQNVTIAEKVDSSHDIENFYYVFEPLFVIPDSVLQVLPIEDRQRFVKSILKLYDTPVNRVLLSVKEHAADDHANVESQKSERKGLLGFFGGTD